MRVADLPPHRRAEARSLAGLRPLARQPTVQSALMRQLRRLEADASRAEFVRLCVAAGLPEPVAEFRFHATRKWAVDWAWPAQRVALEVEGWGHRTRARYAADLPKYNALAEAGWRLVRCVPSERDAPATLAAVRAALSASSASGDGR